MVKKFYLGLISLQYSFILVALPIIIFFLAFSQMRNPALNYRLPMIIVTVILAIVMFFYYKAKIGITMTLRKVKNIDAYEEGGMLDRSYILEDRMLAGYKLGVVERKTTGIHKLQAEHKGRKVILHMDGEEGTFDAIAIDQNEAERFAAFMKRKNPEIVLENIETRGTGTLKELGAVK